MRELSRRVSPRAAELLAELRRPRTLRATLLGARSTELARFEELARLSEPAVLPELLGYIFGSDSAIARAAAMVARETLRSADALVLHALEARIRAPWWTADGVPRGWVNLAPLQVAHFGRFGDAAFAVTALATFHGNGYVREAAVTALRESDETFALPILMLRLNDWVQPVAAAARTAVEERTTSAHTDALVRCLPLVPRLVASTRRDHGWLRERIIDILRSPAQRPALRRWLASGNREIRRTAYRVAREAEGFDRSELARLALADADVVIRREALDVLQELPSNPELDILLERLVRDAFPSIRRDALSLAHARMGKRARPWVLRALTDRSVGVREGARFLLSREEPTLEMAGIYRAHISAPASARELAAALRGLGETGGVGDLDIVVPYLADERTGVRRAALEALGSLGAEGHVDRVCDLLRDPSPSVSGTARRILRPLAPRIGSATLLQLATDAPLAHTRVNAASLATALGKWASLSVLLRLSERDDETTRANALRAISGWIRKQNRVQTTPTRDELADIRRALDEAGSLLSRMERRELEGVLAYWKG